MMEICETDAEVDTYSTNTLRKFSQMYTHDVIYRAISETKDSVVEARRKGGLISNIPGLLIHNIKSIDEDNRRIANEGRRSLSSAT